MGFPLTLQDIGLWLAVIAIILLATSQLLSPYHGKANLPINKKRLRTAAIVVGTLFMVTVVLRILQIMV